jgi:LPS-assembly protein
VNTGFVEKWRCPISGKNKILFILIFCSIFTARTLDARETLKNRFPIDKDSDVKIEALTFDINGDVYTAKEDVVIESGDIKLSAQEAVYNIKKKTAEFPAGVMLEAGENTLSGESGSFDLIKQTGIINNARLFIKENNFYINGGRIEKYGEDSYLIKDFKLTTCDSETPEWSITGSEIDFTLEGYGRLRNGAFRIKDVPVAYIPFLPFPAKTKRQSGVLIPQAGYSSLSGVEFELPVFWAISDSMDMTFYERYMTDRGLMQGLEMRYVSGIDSKGFFNFDVLSDRIEEKDMNDPDQLEIGPYQRTNGGRYWLRGKIDQQLPSGIKARLDADVVSDQDYLREFEGGLAGFNIRPDYEAEFGRSVEEISSPLRTSKLRLARDSENYSLQALSSFYQRPEGIIDDTTPEPLAGLNFSMLPRFLKKVPLSFSLNGDYDYIWRDYGQKGHSLSVSPKVSYPLWFGQYLQFETGTGYTRDMQWLDNDTGNGTGSQSRDVFYAQAKLSTLLERVFVVDSRHAQKIKHKIVPGLTYEYRSYRDEDKYQPWFESIDEDGSTNRVVFSLDNSIDVKKVDEKGNVIYSQWGTFRITQGYDIDESRRDINPEQKKKPFEPLTAELRFLPYSKINMATEVQWDHYKDNFSFADVALKLDVDRAGNRTDIYRLDYVYNDNGNKGLSYYVNINLARGFSLGSTLQRDIEARHNVEKSYWFEYKSQCWGIKLGFQQYDEESSVMVRFQLLGFSY